MSKKKNNIIYSVVNDPKQMRDVFSLRFEVFVNEQNVPPEMEIDEFDNVAIHVVAYVSNTILACGRVYKIHDIAKIGRIAVKKKYRELGIGKMIMQKLLGECYAMNVSYVELNAQVEAIPFYEKFGFQKRGDIFDDAGIPHIKMFLKIGE